MGGNLVGTWYPFSQNSLGLYSESPSFGESLYLQDLSQHMCGM